MYRKVAKEIFIVDSFSTDKTIEIAKSFGAKVYQTKWVLRLDADEYLTDELIEELKLKLPELPVNYTGIFIPFKNAWVDDNLNLLTWWTNKHNDYAIREAVDLLDIEFDLTGNREKKEIQLTAEAISKRNRVGGAVL